MTLNLLRTFASVSIATIFGAFGAIGPGLAAGSHGGGHGSVMAFGAPGDAKAVTRTIELIATDNEFDLPEINVKDGETVRFIIRNRGEFVHEFNIGTPKSHAAHQAEMITMMEHGLITPTSINQQMMNMDHSQMAGMSDGSSQGMMGGMKHDDPNSVLLAPGETKEMIWTFKHAAGLEFACNVPGHYESGMMGSLKVSK